jgi:hypothetical protein
MPREAFPTIDTGRGFMAIPHVASAETTNVRDNREIRTLTMKSFRVLFHQN